MLLAKILNYVFFVSTYLIKTNRKIISRSFIKMIYYSFPFFLLKLNILDRYMFLIYKIIYYKWIQIYIYFFIYNIKNLSQSYYPSISKHKLMFHRMTASVLIILLRFIVMTYTKLIRSFSLIQIHIIYRCADKRKMMNDCFWQKKRCRPSTGSIQDCIWPQSFSLSVHRSWQ
jgi:hypothetical protein